MSNIAELLLGTKTVLEFDPVTGGYFLKVKLETATGENISVDEATGGLDVIDTVHHEVHEGNMYEAGYITGSVANNTSLNLLINLTGTVKDTHVVWEAVCGGDAEVLFYEGVTGSNYGASLNVYNMNRNFPDTPEAQIFSYPTITVLGVNLVDSFIPGGSGGTASGGVIRTGTEWILASGKRYLLRITNRSGNSQYAGLAIQFYQEDRP